MQPFTRLKKKKFIIDTFILKIFILVFKNGELHSWNATPVEPKCLKHLSYSRRMAFLN